MSHDVLKLKKKFGIFEQEVFEKMYRSGTTVI